MHRCWLASVESHSRDEESAPAGKRGGTCNYGFYESIDYTSERLPEDQASCDYSNVHGPPSGHEPRLSLNALQGNRMEERFHSDPSIQATELVLQERVPVGVPTAHPRAEEVLTGRVAQSRRE
jgi:cyclic beta-1,2-glucan synthetase